MAGKAKDLNALIRLGKWTVDERQRELTALLNQEAALLERIAQLDRQMEEERRTAAANPMTAGYLFGGFATRQRLLREQLVNQLQALRQEIEEAREQLAAAFRQLKVYEEVQKDRKTQEKAEEAHKEQLVLDEIGQTQFRRKQGM